MFDKQNDKMFNFNSKFFEKIHSIAPITVFETRCVNSATHLCCRESDKQLFVSKYLVNLPEKKVLENFMKRELNK